MNNPVVCLGASLADTVVVHPTYRFALLALSAHSEVSDIFENARCRTVDFGFGRSSRKLQREYPGGHGRVWTVPVDFADKDADSIVCSLDPDKLIEKLAIIHEVLPFARSGRSVVSPIRGHTTIVAEPFADKEFET